MNAIQTIFTDTYVYYTRLIRVINVSVLSCGFLSFAIPFVRMYFLKKKKRFHSGVHTSTLRIHVEKIKRKGRREEENKKIEREIKKKRKKFIVIVYIAQFQKWNARSRATWKVCYRKFRISSRFTDLSASGNWWFRSGWSGICACTIFARVYALGETEDGN